MIDGCVTYQLNLLNKLVGTTSILHSLCDRMQNRTLTYFFLIVDDTQDHLNELQKPLLEVKKHPLDIPLSFLLQYHHIRKKSFCKSGRKMKN